MSHIFSVFHPLPREDNSYFAIHLLDLIYATDHAFDAFSVLNPSFVYHESTICFACIFHQLAGLTLRHWFAKYFMWRLITAEAAIIFVLRI